MNGQRNRLLGQWGEELAARYLIEHGYRIVDANWRCRFGEIDLIAKEKGYLCFVEVKLRKNDRMASAMEFVDARKQKKLRTTAQLYLSIHPIQEQPRFDVIEVYAPDGLQTVKPEIHHITNAF